MKKAMLYATSLLVASSLYAQEYSVNVELQVEEQELSFSETQAMVFPTLVINRATDENAICQAMTTQPSSVRSVEGSMCFNSRDGRHSNIELSGIPFADISWSLNSDPQTVDGLTFQAYPFGGTVNHKRLDGEGNLTVYIMAQVSLSDKEVALQNDGSKTFTYEFVAAYQ